MITLGTGKRTKEGDEKRDVVDSGKNRSEGGTGNFKRSTLGVWLAHPSHHHSID
jgi:hypothetical protein